MPNPMTPPPSQESYQLSKWLQDVQQRFTGPFLIPSYTAATLPSANKYKTDDYTGLVYVSDSTTLAFSDGTNWINVQDGSTI